MPSIKSENLKTYVSQGILSGIITGFFTFLFFRSNWLTFVFGFLIGVQAYTYISLSNAKLRHRLNRLNFTLALLISTISNIFLILIAVLLSIVVINGFDLTFFTDGYFKDFVLSQAMLYGLIFGLIMSFLFNAYSMFDNLLGKNFLLKIFTGKYHQPFEEERIFMFLDLISSTTIAEKIGHKQFLSLLNDFFFDLAEPVTATRGEIYKYVGDEAIISWKMKTGIRHMGPLRCFFMMKARIEQNSERYKKKYGVVPRFKAGVHGGTVVTGELGFVKKEITYLGDVINTTSRIEAACNEFDKLFIVSDDILNKLAPGNEYLIQKLGDIKFRGKEVPIGISSVEEK
jgi:adenylate cyclase